MTKATDTVADNFFENVVDITYQVVYDTDSYKSNHTTTQTGGLK